MAGDRADADVGIGELVSQLAGDAREMAQAEIALVKARVAQTTTRYRGAVTYFAIAGVLALAALIALLVGLILSIATLIGPGLATAVVVGTVLLIAGILGLVGKARLTRPAA